MRLLYISFLCKILHIGLLCKRNGCLLLLVWYGMVYGKIDVATGGNEHEAWRKFLLCAREQGHYVPHRATGKVPGFGLVAEDGSKQKV